MSHVLNVAPIIYDAGQITVEQLEYSDDLFESLHKTHLGSHLIKRSDSSIILVPLKKNSPTYGGSQATVDLKADLSLVKSLARESIYRQLLKRGVHISSTRPISYLVPQRNLLDDCIPANIRCIQGLGLFARWEVDFRVINPKGDNAFVSLSLNISTAPRITKTCYSLNMEGFPIAGYYVGVSRSGKNPDLRPHFQVIGKAVRILDNGMLELDDVREGWPSVIDPLTMYLEPREDILESCIRYYYRNDAPQILDKMQQKATAFHTGDRKHKKLVDGLKVLQKFNLEITNDIPFQIGDFLSDEDLETRQIKVETGEKPLFVFSYGGGQNNLYNDLGLQKYGPYSKESFSPAKPRICVICQKTKKGQVELVLQKFLNGIPPIKYGKGGKQFEFTGLKTKFYLQECILEFFVAPDDTVDGYNIAITAAMQVASMERRWDLAIIQIDNNFRDRPGALNPYLVSKARFIGQNIPVQEFTLEALGLPDERIVWSLNNMALASYAKLGGVPWLLAADKPLFHELVFGIGSSTIQSSRFGQKERMIGITTVFTGDGNYFLNNLSAAVLSDQYFDTLLANLRSTMTQVRRSYNWQPKDTVRLIFHAFKTLKNIEADVVKQVVSELGNFNVEFSFIHVADNHPYLLFDTQQKGFFKKGIFAPERGRYIHLSEHVSLVSLTGPQELKKATDGLPSPVQLILHRDSTFRDLTYLSKQVIKFGAHSWRSFQPAPMPVSIYYSQLMAQMLSQLSSISQWNSDALYNKIGRTRWFL